MLKFAPVARRLEFGAMLFLSIGLAGCARTVSEPIRIGINAWPGYEFLYLAAESGILARHGLNVELKEYSSLDDTRRAFERGQIDGMASTMVEVLQASGRASRRPRIVLVTDHSAGGDVILARPGIRSVAELRGRLVAAETASLGGYVFWRAAEKAGIAADSVRLKALDQAEMEGAVRQGQVDAVVTYPPVSLAIEQLGWKRVFDSRQLPGEIVDVVSVDASTLERMPDLQMRLMEVWADALAYFRANRAGAVRVMSARERLTPAQFEAALASLELLDVAAMREHLEPQGRSEGILRRVEKALRDAGQLTGAERWPGTIEHLAPLARAAGERQSGR